MIQSISIYS